MSVANCERIQKSTDIYVCALVYEFSQKAVNGKMWFIAQAMAELWELGFQNIYSGDSMPKRYLLLLNEFQLFSLSRCPIC